MRLKWIQRVWKIHRRTIRGQQSPDRRDLRLDQVRKLRRFAHVKRGQDSTGRLIALDELIDSVANSAAADEDGLCLGECPRPMD